MKEVQRRQQISFANWPNSNTAKENILSALGLLVTFRPFTQSIAKLLNSCRKMDMEKLRNLVWPELKKIAK